MARKLKPNEPAEIVLPTAAFLDMAFQLFAFFIITYNPSSLEGQMEMALPAAGEARAAAPEDVDPTAIPDQDLELKGELVVSVKTNHEARDGSIGSISVEDNSGVAKDVPVQMDKDPNLHALRDYLKQTQKGLQNKDAIKIQAESALKHAFIVKVMDACASAGFTNIGFAPPPDLSTAP
jgi:biopolymer transport protein ExbD